MANAWARLWGIVLFVVLLASACSTSDEPASCTGVPERSEHTYRQLDGVASDETSLDVRSRPGSSQCPVVIWVHGGSWQEGDKRSRLTTAKANYLAAQGFVFVSVNYRLASSDNSVRWPDFGDDVASAVVWVRDNAEMLGVDPNATTLLGHSAGAHLVSILGTNPGLLERAGGNHAEIACVISLDSVTHDLTNEPPWETDIIELAFPTNAARRDASPTLQLRDADDYDGPAFLIVTRGRDARIESSDRLASAIKSRGGSAEVVNVSPYDHAEVSNQLGVANDELVTPAVEQFLVGCR